MTKETQLDNLYSEKKDAPPVEVSLQDILSWQTVVDKAVDMASKSVLRSRNPSEREQTQLVARQLSKMKEDLAKYLPAEG